MSDPHTHDGWRWKLGPHRQRSMDTRVYPRVLAPFMNVVTALTLPGKAHAHEHACRQCCMEHSLAFTGHSGQTCPLHVGPFHVSISYLKNPVQVALLMA